MTEAIDVCRRLAAEEPALLPTAEEMVRLQDICQAARAVLKREEELAQPVTEEWLRSAGAKKHDWHPVKWTFFRDDALAIGLWHVDDGWKAMGILAEHSSICIVRGLQTRGDVLRLLAALGIPTKERV